MGPKCITKTAEEKLVARKESTQKSRDRERTEREEASRFKCCIKPWACWNKLHVHTPVHYCLTNKDYLICSRHNALVTRTAKQFHSVPKSCQACKKDKKAQRNRFPKEAGRKELRWLYENNPDFVLLVKLDYIYPLEDGFKWPYPPKAQHKAPEPQVEQGEASVTRPRPSTASGPRDRGMSEEFDPTPCFACFMERLEV
jgi:hypothetical protein